MCAKRPHDSRRIEEGKPRRNTALSSFVSSLRLSCKISFGKIIIPHYCAWAICYGPANQTLTKPGVFHKSFMIFLSPNPRWLLAYMSLFLYSFKASLYVERFERRFCSIVQGLSSSSKARQHLGLVHTLYGWLCVGHRKHRAFGSLTPLFLCYSSNIEYLLNFLSNLKGTNSILKAGKIYFIKDK